MKYVHKTILWIPYIGFLYMLFVPEEYIDIGGKYWQYYHGTILGLTPVLLAIIIGVIANICK